MARPNLLKLDPIPPHWDELDPRQIQLSYDRPTDTLIIALFEDRSAVSVPVGEHGYLRVDPETQEVTGYMVEEFLTTVIYDHPELLALIEHSGVLSAPEITHIRQRIGPDSEKRAAVSALFGRLVPSFA